MKSKRKIIVYIATSADGNIDWLNFPRTAGYYGMGAFFKNIDTILWGRKTYDESLGLGYPGKFGLKVKNYVFTHRPPEIAAPGVEFVSESIVPSRNAPINWPPPIIQSFRSSSEKGFHWYIRATATSRSNSPPPAASRMASCT